MDSQEGSRWQFPTDAFVEILLRLPPNTRHRFRLVSRHWRNVVDESSFMFPQCPKTIVVTDGCSPFVVDDRTGRRRDLWSSSTPARCTSLCIVGTSNGLVCLCDDEVAGGAITVANPVTGETLDVPPLPLPPSCDDADQEQCHPVRWHQAYSFGYLPTTKRYKVVRVPCRFDDQDCEFPTLQVFTLGEESWREVVIPASLSGCNLGLGIVNINGTMYWIAADGHLVSFDLEEECAMLVRPQPWMSNKCFLTEVHGRLGVVVRDFILMDEHTVVWVMDNPQWSRWYILQVTPPRKRPGQRRRGYQRLTRPHFVQYTDHVLTWESNSGHVGLYKHKPPKNNESIGWGRGGWGRVVGRIDDRDRGLVVADIEGCSDTRVFAYVETRESLNAYTLGDKRRPEL
ncbi:putative F-box protein At1g32420 [Lolium perenne]|jgi:F-box interacting protein|uniref:putative F-box protein At1g32420 n=1 Tax=Lolium perenne TaxID=4522 RepID=UPI0021EA9B0D|nr:F-box protein At3g49450-like [Lolium perenne]